MATTRCRGRFIRIAGKIKEGTDDPLTSSKILISFHPSLRLPSQLFAV